MEQWSDGIMLFLIALQFLTRISVKRNLQGTDALLSKSMVFFPVVGLLVIGGIQAIVFWGIYRVLSPTVVALFLLLIPIIITGALHIEGFADMVDGFWSGRNKEEILRIMKDSHIGVMGTIGITCLILAKFVLLREVVKNLDTLLIIELLLLIPTLSRWAMVIACGVSQYARQEGGVGKAFTEGAGKGIVYLSSIVPIMLSVLCFRIWGLIGIGIAILVPILVSGLAKKIIGGITGDILGAVNEITEFVLLLSVMLVIAC